MRKNSKAKQDQAITFWNSSSISCSKNISKISSPSIEFLKKCKINNEKNISTEEWNRLLSLRQYTFRKMIGLSRWERVAHEIILSMLTSYPSEQERDNAIHFLIKHTGLRCNKNQKIDIGSEVTEHLSETLDIRHDILIKFNGGEISIEIKLNGNVEQAQYNKYRHWQSLKNKHRHVIILKPDTFYEATKYKDKSNSKWLHFVECNKFVDFFLENGISMKSCNQREWTIKEYELFNMLIKGVGAI